MIAILKFVFGFFCSGICGFLVALWFFCFFLLEAKGFWNRLNILLPSIGLYGLVIVFFGLIAYILSPLFSLCGFLVGLWGTIFIFARKEKDTIQSNQAI